MAVCRLGLSLCRRAACLVRCPRFLPRHSSSLIARVFIPDFVFFSPAKSGEQRRRFNTKRVQTTPGAHCASLPSANSRLKSFIYIRATIAASVSVCVCLCECVSKSDVLERAALTVC